MALPVAGRSVDAKKSFASYLMGRDGKGMLADVENRVKERGWSSGRRFAGGNAADPPGHVQTVLGTAAVLHPGEDFRKTDPGIHTVHVRFERALVALQGADHVAPVGVNPPLVRPQRRAASTAGERAERIKVEGCQHRKLLSWPRVSNGSVTKSRMCPPVTSSPRQPASPSSLPSANEGGKVKGMEGNSGLGHRLPGKLAAFSISLPQMESDHDDERFNRLAN